jgi:hypothetical protein
VPDSGWTSVVTYSDPISAEAVRGLLEAEGVPCRIAPSESFPGLALFYAVEVPTPVLYRARWLLASAEVSENELNYLATGELPGDSTKK